MKAATCDCPVGLCRRWSPEGKTDWYEPCEPLLERAGLPWFYFIPSPSKLVEELRGAYILESEALWGRRHWEN
ncbi:hypothetical protein K7W42_06975 [Deinococcus sp. HMF7604]|uniref:hypothetical protein n=1 Tax=Deinococcus betulae TaxID=2873312 RepID=UPI001CCE0652|nr:hypothetical protein [Deinococcus betulae]MBZ9750601.1 hypothetical protein [Deinococcus betulae]